MIGQVIGVSPTEQDLTEQDLYERLLSGPASLDELGGAPDDVPGSAAQVPLAALARLREVLSARGRALAGAAQHIAELDQRFTRAVAQHGAPAGVELVHGREAILRNAAQMQQDVREQIRACDAPPYPEANPAAVNTTELDHLRRGIRYRILYDRRALDLPGRLADLEAGIAAGEQARVADVPLKMTIIDDSVAVLPVQHPADVESRVVVRDPVLLGALSALFEMYWERALPLRVSNGRAQLSGEGNGPSADEAHLLPLLVAGLTDQEIAAQLGLSDRTVRSRVRAMMARLDATTRFQAGYQAVSRGWLANDDAG
jgi:Bacterial regulatory proteins, luxR family